jgi:hypothetical protein
MRVSQAAAYALIAYHAAFAVPVPSPLGEGSTDIVMVEHRSENAAYTALATLEARQLSCTQAFRYIQTFGANKIT